MCQGTRCAAPTTPIDTPLGPRPIAELRVGDLVWSMAAGQLVAAPLVRVGSTPAHDHHVVRLVLDDGTVLLVSPGHPLADGTTIGELRAGAIVGARRVLAADLVPYAFTETHDILPATPSGVYFSAGIALGSTLAH